MSIAKSASLCSLALAALIGLAGCDTGTDPGPSQLGDFDPDAVRQGIENTLIPVQTSTEANQNLIMALRDLEDDGVVVVDNGPAVAFSRIDDVRSLVRIPNPILPSVEFPDTLIGKTVVYAPVTDSWRVDASRTGAPTDAVRLIYYGIDPTGRLVFPLLERGYIDLYDLDAGGLSRLRSVAYNAEGSSPVLVMDLTQGYSRTITASDTTEHLEANGQFNSGSVTVGFSLQADLTSLATGDQTYSFVMGFNRSAATYDFDWSGSYDAANEAYSDDFDIGYSENAVATRLLISSDNDVSPLTGTGTGTLTNGGATVAGIDLTNGAVRFNHPDGASFSSSDRAALENLTSTMWVGGFFILASLPLTIYI